MVINKYIVYATLLLLFCSFDLRADQTGPSPAIAKWYQNKTAAVSLRFDDSRESQVKYAVPILNEYGFLATFMVNPGNPEFQKYKDFWENELPEMGHRMGNHTMHHRGAKNLEEADYEIGEVTRLIWRLYPDSGKLNVFASGGGGLKWGGKLWEHADKKYKMLVKKYDLIDLYDGFHQSKPYNSTDTPEQYCKIIEQTIRKGEYQAFHFHNVGISDFKDKLKRLFRGVSLAIDVETFRKILDCLKERKDVLWIAPIIDILKYESEYKSASIEILKYHEKEIDMKLKIGTDASLYNQPLTLIIPIVGGRYPDKIVQNNVAIHGYSKANSNDLLFDVKPIESRITVFYK